MIDSGGVSWDEREWLKEVLKNAGAEITGAGFGFGGADISFRLAGKSYHLKLRRSSPAFEEEEKE